jgi:hypothetical protein
VSRFLAKALFLILALAHSLCAMPLFSESGTFNTTNDVFLRTFTFDPAVHGSTLRIQTWGYGGTAGAPGGTNALGAVIPPGGFDPIVWLFQGSGPSASLIAWNDDGACPPGTPSPYCYDSTLELSPLQGTYTLALTMYNVRPVNFFIGGLLGGGWITNFYNTFGARTSAFAVDALAPNAPEPPDGSQIPEPATFALLGGGLMLLAFLRRKRP